MPSPFSVRSQTNPGTDLGEWDASGNITIPGTIRAGALSGPVSSNIISVTLAGAATTSDVITIQLPVDGYSRMVVNADGKIEWGSGAAAVDTNLYRLAADTLFTDDTFFTSAGLIVGGGTTPYFAVGATGAISMGDGTLARDTNLYRSAANVLATDDSFSLKTAGTGVSIKEGANATMGVATLNGGVGVDVLTTKVTANSRIFLSVQSEVSVTSGDVWIQYRTAGTSFNIRSIAGNDAACAWWIVEPST